MISLADYCDVRDKVIKEGFIEDIHWSESLTAPDSAETLAREAIFVICNSGMKWEVARPIFERVMHSLEGFGVICEGVFGHKLKCKAISYIWKNRDRLFAEFVALGDDEARLEWCDALPHIGRITKYHLAKNLGVNVAKPDRHLERLSLASGETVQGMCERLSREHGDRAATVDVVLWRACACGIIDSAHLAQVDAAKGEAKG